MSDLSSNEPKTPTEVGKGNQFVYQGPPLRNLKVVISPLQMKTSSSIVKTSPRITQSLSAPPAIQTSSSQIQKIQGNTLVLTKAADGTMKYLKFISSSGPSATSGNVIKLQTIPSNTPLTIANPSLARVKAQSAQNSILNIKKEPGEVNEKCVKFLKTLIELSKKRDFGTQRIITFLIQSLVNSTMKPLEFCQRVEQTIKAKHQPKIVKLLTKNLPNLRQSMTMNETIIEGITPPMKTVPKPIPVQINKKVLLKSGQTFTLPSTLKISSTPLVVANNTAEIPKKTPPPSNPFKIPPSASILFKKPSPPQQSVFKVPAPPPNRVQVRSTSSFNSNPSEEDEDVNDVVGMSGINLKEEKEQVFGSVYSLKGKCKDKPIVNMEVIRRRIQEKLAAHGLDGAGSGVSDLIGHATQEYLKNIAEKLSNIAEHRADNLKVNQNYETTSDVRTQIKFLGEVEKAKETKKEEQYREHLMNAAKSKSKSVDAAIRAKAREVQREEFEEMNRQQANNTALLALGGMKRASTAPKRPLSGPSTLPPRAKRVKLDDLIFHMERDKNLNKSELLYKLYLK